MTVLNIARLGAPVLRQIAKEVDPAEIGTPELQKFLDDLIETCHANDGAGLAAPQVFVPKRIVMMEWGDDERDDDEPPSELRLVINPEIRFLTKETFSHDEGCLSVPDLRGEVVRVSKIRLRGLDRDGKPFEELLEGFPAAVAQHECDHLDGIVFLDRMKTLKSLSFLDEYRENLKRRSARA